MASAFAVCVSEQVWVYIRTRFDKGRDKVLHLLERLLMASNSYRVCNKSGAVPIFDVAT